MGGFQGYYIREVNFNKFIEIILYDEDKYRSRMSKTTKRLDKINGVMNYSPFAIAWGQVKRKDRNRLAYELDRRAFAYDESLYDQMDADKRKQKSQSQVNGKYLLKSYGFSWILTGAVSLLFYWDDTKDLLRIWTGNLYSSSAFTWHLTVIRFLESSEYRHYKSIN